MVFKDGMMKLRARSASWIVGAATLLAALAALILTAPPVLAAHPAAHHRHSRPHRIRHACRKARPGHAACLALRLLPPSTPSTAPVAVAASVRGRPSVTYKTPEPGYLTPEALHAAYSLPAETASSYLQTIAVVDAYNDPTAEADLAVFDKQFGLPPCTAVNGCLRKVNQQGNASPLPPTEGGWASEISIDVQMAHSICNSCRILLVEADGEEFTQLGAAVNTAVNAGATEISNSYGAPEVTELMAENPAYDHPGVVLTVSSGDCGYLNQACTEGEAEGKGAEFPAASPDVVAVGGTSLVEGAGGWKSTAWAEGGSGCSHVFSAPLWQLAVPTFAATGCGTGRSVADTSAIGDPETGVDVYDSTPEGHGAPTGWGVWGGTSVASPIVAAEFALAGGSHGVQYPALTLYRHLGESAALYDVTSGTNGSCAGATSCRALAGYDGPTGVGSPVGLSSFSTPGAPAGLTRPSISGFSEQGSTLTLAPGSWTGSPTSTSHQWELCNGAGAACAPIAGATGTTLALAPVYVGATIRVQETAANAAGVGAPQSSPPTAPVTSDIPSVGAFTPASGITGSAVTIEGTALAATTAVFFGTTPASFSVISPTKLEAIVPDGARKGKITVTTPVSSVVTRAKFVPTLAVTRLSPSSGAIGRKVTIKGVGFAAGASVSFGAVAATSVTLASSKSLKVIVPSGAVSGPVTVTNTQAPTGTVRSAVVFTVG